MEAAVDVALVDAEDTEALDSPLEIFEAEIRFDPLAVYAPLRISNSKFRYQLRLAYRRR